MLRYIFFSLTILFGINALVIFLKNLAVQGKKKNEEEHQEEEVVAEEEGAGEDSERRKRREAIRKIWGHFDPLVEDIMLDNVVNADFWSTIVELAKTRKPSYLQKVLFLEIHGAPEGLSRPDHLKSAEELAVERGLERLRQEIHGALRTQEQVLEGASTSAVDPVDVSTLPAPSDNSAEPSLLHVSSIEEPQNRTGTKPKFRKYSEQSRR